MTPAARRRCSTTIRRWRRWRTSAAYYTPFYIAIGVSGLKIWPETDPVAGNKIVAWKLSGFNFDVITIWMDGRPHPSQTAFHPYSGFTTGIWQGDVLVTHTTHMKAGFLRRNGAPSSDQATMTQFIVRHGDLLTITSMLEDPVYLTEPYVVSRSFQLDPRANIRTTQGACEPITEVAGPGCRPASCRSYLPGKQSVRRGADRGSTTFRSKRFWVARRRCIPSTARRSRTRICAP